MIRKDTNKINLMQLETLIVFESIQTASCSMKRGAYLITTWDTLRHQAALRVNAA